MNNSSNNYNNIAPDTIKMVSKLLLLLLLVIYKCYITIVMIANTIAVTTTA